MNKQGLKIPRGWEIKKIKDFIDYERPDKFIVKDTNYIDDGKIPVLTANKSFILGYTNEDFGIYKNVPVIIFDDFTTNCKYVDFPFKVKSSAIKILKTKSRDVNLKYIYETIKFIKFPIGSHKRYYISQYQNLDIVVPKNKVERDKIVKILSSIDNKVLINNQIREKLIQLKKGLMQDLLSGKVRVKI